MGLTLTTGNLLTAEVDALVNTVNTVGVMGKGIALQFKQVYPENFAVYQAACRRGEVRPGEMFVYATQALAGPRFIINFPTKRDWKAKARLEDIETGLTALINVVQDKSISSIAVPPLGCGNGGLKWETVRPLIETAFSQVPEVCVYVYTPDGAPQADAMVVATTRPNMTPSRAALLGILNRYALPGYRTTLLEIQKLVYFLQEAGEPFGLHFEKEIFGPYAETLHYILQRIEGHFIRGYGDRSRSVEVRVLPEAEREADLFIEDHPATRDRRERVIQLIEGFETPRGLELLATVHWVCYELPLASPVSAEEAIHRVHSWSKRKRETFPPEQIRVAFKRLQKHGWIA